MTTICYKENVLASDSLTTCGDIVFDNDVKKLVRVKIGWIGCCGETDAAEKLAMYLNGQGDESTTHNINVKAILMQDNGDTYYIASRGDTLHRSRVTSDCWAIGSGYEIALGAMSSGLSAIEAVKVAIERDIYSGGKIQSVKRGQKK